jgi:hypothetical protein
MPTTSVIATVMAISCAGAYGQTLQQTLDSQFTLTKFSKDKARTVRFLKEWVGSAAILQSA